MLHLLHAANKLQAAGMSRLHRQDRRRPAEAGPNVVPDTVPDTPAVDPEAG